ncbi:MAG: SUMF1/EgtB/PvdO family nonheme iron enzyme [Spirochaetaceae bacterium]|jgi:formylglycine-generating enzyme required for sulfatase activity|nr:SUMF1/EgtB/PvdO family nonheme iron enzyme [Spirochaetaceae bacterium]
MTAEFHSLLTRFIKETGIEILDRPEQCKEALRQYAKDGYKREIRLFAIGLEAGCHQEFLKSAEPELTKQMLVKKLEDDFGVSSAYAEETVNLIRSVIYTTERSEKIIAAELERNARAGNPRAQYELGRLYESQGNYNEALRWFQEAAKQDVGSYEQSLNEDLAPLPAKEKPKTSSDAFIRIKGGDFMMGSPASEANRREDEQQHSVKLNAFFIGKFPVTQEEYEIVMGLNPSNFQGSRLPVEKISWYDAIEYCNKRSLLEGLTPAYDINKSRYDINNTNDFDKNKWLVTPIEGATGYRLPTEAEWEYACRAGTKTPYHTGDVISPAQANYNDKSGTPKLCTVKVGSYPHNAWGLYEMHGNIYEWCWDWYSAFSGASSAAPLGSISGTQRVLRGGSWNKSFEYLRSAARICSTPSLRSSEFGIRLAKNG